MEVYDKATLERFQRMKIEKDREIKTRRLKAAFMKADRIVRKGQEYYERRKMYKKMGIPIGW